MKFYKLDENTLKDILASAYYFWALESGGVDNWEWFGESVQELIDGVNKENGTCHESIEDIVAADLKTEFAVCTCRESKSPTFSEIVNLLP